VETDMGRGSRFFVELPIVACLDQLPELEVPGGEKQLADPHACQRRLLIVDDEPGIVEVLKEILGKSGYSVETACNGTEALARLASQPYDLVLSDLCMPEMGGEKLYRVLSERFPHLRQRVVFVTGDTVSPASRRFLVETGAPWLSKPFKIHEIEKIVMATLRDGGSAAEPALPQVR
jgi:CheY-like chemotaxis protein